MNFRRVLTALAMVVVFTAIASAQIPIAQQIPCTVTAATTANVRSEGITEKVGDVILTCTNGPTPNAGTIDRATITVDFGVPVTSRVDNLAAPAVNGSEALLAIDEPGLNGGAVAGYGPNAAASICPANPAGGCAATASQIGTIWVMSTVNPAGVFPAATPAANVYQGVNGTGSNNTKVIFANVPIMAPGSSAVQRVYRITNVRVTPGSVASVTATVTVTPNAGSTTTLNLTNNGVTVASAQSGLAGTVSAVGGASLCTTTSLNPAAGQSKANLALLNFKEVFNTAFKTKVLPLNNAAAEANTGNGAGVVAQNMVSGSYTTGVAPNTLTWTAANSESGYIPGGIAVAGVQAGLANSGTRLKAIFKNLSANAQYYVSLNPVIDYQTNAAAPVAPGDQSTQTWAQLLGPGVNGAAAGDSAAFPVPPALPAAAAPAPNNVANGVVPVALVTRAADGSGQVVWEVTNTQAASIETLTFALYASYSNVTNPPTVGNTATVQLALGPATTSTATFIPRFAAPSSATTNFFNVLPCQTVLLFPFVTNNAKFETGIAISNTSKDPFNTASSEGACAMNFYGANQPAAAVSSGTIAAGSTFANTVSGMGLVNFQGYMVSVCNFQYAHGFAFVNDGNQTMAMGYLALVMNTEKSGVTRGATMLGESFGQ